jgi:2-polyprenyl-3-methyl-5-hydroxy-6-metoxy-1,4-benzoquinol methylase
MDKNTMDDKSLYDDLYKVDDEGHDRSFLPYVPLFRRVTEIVSTRGISPVLEVGCGHGLLAEMLLHKGIDYHGFDFHDGAIEKAKKLNGAEKHFVADATNPDSYAVDYNGIVSCEVLEHIGDDVGVVKLWKPGSTCVCSVPNFDYPTHVRFFRSESEITTRYGELLEFQSVERIPKSPKTGLTWEEYFRRLRWARKDPKTFLGCLGFNSFDWHGGWFIFVAKRRQN